MEAMMKFEKCVRRGAMLASLCLVSGFAFAQVQPMRATITNEPGDGKCTFEIRVDGSAEVEIHGDLGNLRTTSGAAASWRRLVCNRPLPNNPAGFRFQGIDGRGRQELIRDPNSSGGVAVIRITDPQGGSEGYTGDILWRTGDTHFGGVGNWSSGHAQEPDRDQHARREEWGHAVSRIEAVNICRNQVSTLRNMPVERVRATPGQQEPDGDLRVNFTFVNPYGRTKEGFCSISGSGQVLQFQVEEGERRARVSWNQSLDICQQEVSKSFGVARDDVRVQHGADPGNGSFLINYQARDRVGRIRTGVCRVSAVGDIEEIRKW